METDSLHLTTNTPVVEQGWLAKGGWRFEEKRDIRVVLEYPPHHICIKDKDDAFTMEKPSRHQPDL